MPSIKIYKQTGEEAGTLNLDDSVFGVEYNESLIHQAVTAQRNNARQGTKCTLTRTEVRGGGIKPWRQKGTGRARQGSIRAPQWIKGGVVFAPKPRDFSQKVNKQARRNALISALSEKVRAEQLVVVDEIKLPAPKTKEMAKVLAALKLDKRVLLVVTDADADVVRAANNLENVKTLPSSQINVYDVVANTKLLATKAAITKIEEAYKA
ncbi:MAG: 50S ribosomal protein L4 [Clostridia bacterium]|jgi:large subunit ribosomal protein L4|nr:50S ribosomal protein L4 [Clostridia bacterium]